jgi:hypothetical protein
VKAIGFTWGVGGVLLLLCFAIYRLAPLAMELEDSALTVFQWCALVFSVAYMAYAEGYKGFHLGFAPRVVKRADYLGNNPQLGHIILAPLFCMGYIYATRRRKMFSFGLTIMISCFILIARLLPQPWRGILDAGVVVGLTIGIFSILYFLLQIIRNPELVKISPEVPSE